MYPTLFKIGNFELTTFGLMMAIAFFSGVGVLAREFRRRDLSEDHAWGLRLLGEAQLGHGELESGRRTLREAAREAGRLHRPELEREVLLLLSDSYQRGGRAGDAFETRQMAQAILEEMAMKIAAFAEAGMKHIQVVLDPIDAAGVEELAQIVALI